MPGAPNHSGAPKSSSNVTSTFFNGVNLLPKELRFEHEGAKLVSCPGRHLISLRPWARPIRVRKYIPKQQGLYKANEKYFKNYEIIATFGKKMVR